MDAILTRSKIKMIFTESEKSVITPLKSHSLERSLIFGIQTVFWADKKPGNRPASLTSP